MLSGFVSEDEQVIVEEPPAVKDVAERDKEIVGFVAS
jgi:hypothetical protein